MTPARLLVLAAVALLLGGCEPLACDAMAVASVNVTLLDEQGEAFAPDEAVVQFEHDGADPVDCERFDDQWVCGWEVSGEVLVLVSVPGYEGATASAEVEHDGCHPIAEQLEIQLDRRPSFATPRAFEHVLYTGQDCDDAMAAGVNCAQWVAFCPDGSAEIVVTDIIDPGTYVLDADGLDASFPGGDAPPTMRFDWDGDDLVHAASGDVWSEADAPDCD